MNQMREELRRLLAVVPGKGPGEFGATLTLPANFALFADHFPGQPVLPGFCLLQLVLAATEIHFRRTGLELQQVKSAKFLAPVLPEQPLTIHGQITVAPEPDLLAIKATVIAGDQKAASISLLAAWQRAQ